MKNKGRIASLFFLISFIFLFHITHKTANTNYRMLIPVTGMVLYLVVFYYAGLQYDRANYYANEIKKSRERIQEIINNLPAAIWSVKLKDNKHFISDGFENMDLIPIEEFKAKPNIWESRVHPDDKEIFLSAQKEILGGNRDKLEYRIIGNDGLVRWVQSNFNVVFNKEGQADSINSVILDVTDRKNIENELIEAEDKYRNLVENALIGVYIYQGGRLIYVNNYFEKMSGYSNKELLKIDILENLLSRDKENFLKMLRRLDNGEKEISLQIGGHKKDGSIVDIELNASKILYRGEIAYIGTVKNITQQRKAIEVIKENEKILSEIFNNIQDGMCLLDKELNIIKTNRVIRDWFEDGINIDGCKCYSVYDKNKKTCDSCPALKAMETRSHQTHLVKRILTDKKTRWLEVHAYPLINEEGEITGVIEQIRDITERKIAEDKISKMAYHDALTGLPNRYLLNDYIERAVARAKRRNQNFGIIFIDLDRFKMINDTMGHSLGDRVLKEVSSRLLSCIRKDDIVCRHGGDEFIILMEEIDRIDVTNAAQRILNELSKPIKIDSKEIYTTPSMGISMYPDDSDDGETLIKYADTAMYLAKDSGKNNYKFYTSSLNEEISRKMNIENGLRKALENKEFEMYYQPQVDIETGNIVGVEALIRWNHPEHGVVPPMEFIPLAEETGLIVPIGRWVLEESCRQNKKWQKEYNIFVPISVNISARQIYNGVFYKTIENILRDTGLEAKYLEIEITESIMQDTKNLPKILGKIRQIGVNIAIDDFGTGYSSLSLLKNISIDRIKIDRSFTKEIEESKVSASLVKVIIEMGKSLGLGVIAEGIETSNQGEYLLKNGCGKGQGYLYSKALRAEDIEKNFWNKN